MAGSSSCQTALAKRTCIQGPPTILYWKHSVEAIKGNSSRVADGSQPAAVTRVCLSSTITLDHCCLCLRLPKCEGSSALDRSYEGLDPNAMPRAHYPRFL